MNVRRYKPTDIPSLASLFRDCVRRVCARDYNLEQLKTWAPDTIDFSTWGCRLANSFTLVAEQANEPIGFANLDTDGNVDMLYVHANWQSKGVGKLLISRLEAHAREIKLGRLYSDVSITARPFFQKMGFKIDEEITKEVRGVTFRNALMSKELVD